MITKLTATLEDGSEVVLFPVTQSTPAPIITEVDVKISDGTEETFVPKTSSVA